MIKAINALKKTKIAMQYHTDFEKNIKKKFWAFNLKLPFVSPNQTQLWGMFWIKKNQSFFKNVDSKLFYEGHYFFYSDFFFGFYGNFNTRRVVVSWYSQNPWVAEHNITRSVFMLCSAAHIVLENHLTVTWLERRVRTSQLNVSCFEISLFSSPTQCVKKGGDFKTRELSSYPESFLYYLYSSVGNLKKKKWF